MARGQQQASAAPVTIFYLKDWTIGKISRNVWYIFNTVKAINVWWRKCILHCNSTGVDDLTIDHRTMSCKFLLLSSPCELKLITGKFLIFWYVLLFRALYHVRHNSDCPAPFNNAVLSVGNLHLSISLSNVFHTCTSTNNLSLLWVQYLNRAYSDTLNKHGETIEKIGTFWFITTENAGLPSREKMSWLRLRSVSLFSCWILLYIAVHCCILLYIRFRLRSVTLFSCWILLYIAVHCCILLYIAVYSLSVAFGIFAFLLYLALYCCILLYISFRLRLVSLFSCWILLYIAVYCCIFAFGCVLYLCFLAESCCILLYIRFPRLRTARPMTS